MTSVVVAVLALAVGVAGGFVAYRAVMGRRVDTAEARAAKLVADAELEAETKVRDALVEVKEEISAMRREAERDVGLRREEVRRNEERLLRREEQADRKLNEVSAREQQLAKVESDLTARQTELAQAVTQQQRELERISRMTSSEARDALMAQVVDQAKRDAMATVREIEQQAREEGEKRARKIVTIAIQRVASEQTAESTVAVFPLPSDDMKGRIIGREGRNIRAFEALTGVNLIIDDTPEAVVLSCFDPVRREVARLTLEKLVADGRIHPARIE